MDDIEKEILIIYTCIVVIVVVVVYLLYKFSAWVHNTSEWYGYSKSVSKRYGRLKCLTSNVDMCVCNFLFNIYMVCKAHVWIIGCVGGEWEYGAKETTLILMCDIKNAQKLNPPIHAIQLSSLAASLLWGIIWIGFENINYVCSLLCSFSFFLQI